MSFITESWESQEEPLAEQFKATVSSSLPLHHVEPNLFSDNYQIDSEEALERVMKKKGKQEKSFAFVVKVADVHTYIIRIRNGMKVKGTLFFYVVNQKKFSCRETQNIPH